MTSLEGQNVRQFGLDEVGEGVSEHSTIIIPSFLGNERGKKRCPY